MFLLVKICLIVDQEQCMSKTDLGSALHNASTHCSLNISNRKYLTLLAVRLNIQLMTFIAGMWLYRP